MYVYSLKPGTMIEWGNNWARGITYRRSQNEAFAAYFSQVGRLYNVHHIWCKWYSLVDNLCLQWRSLTYLRTSNTPFTHSTRLHQATIVPEWGRCAHAPTFSHTSLCIGFGHEGKHETINHSYASVVVALSTRESLDGAFEREFLLSSLKVIKSAFCFYGNQRGTLDP